MPERDLHREALRLGAPVTIGAVTLLPVERTAVAIERAAGHAWCLAGKQVHALIVGDARGTRALGLDGSAMPLDALCAQVNGLEAAMAGLPGAAP